MPASESVPETLAGDLKLEYVARVAMLDAIARRMTTGCPRAAERAALLLERIAADPDADPYLRAHARELLDILEREPAADARRMPLTGSLARRASH